MSDNVSIKLDGAVRASAFIRAVVNFFRVARNVSDEMTGNKVEWLTSVKEGSNIVIGHPRVPQNPAFAPEIAKALFGGMQSIATGVKQRPQFFNDGALDAMRQIATTDVQEISILSNGDIAHIDRESAATVDIILGSSHKSFGEVEGRLSVLSDHGGFKFFITESLHEHEVACYITKDELIDRAIAAFRKRVSANGLIKYRRDGTPLSIDVDDLRVFINDQFPSTEDVVGIYKKG